MVLADQNPESIRKVSPLRAPARVASSGWYSGW
jgi:hypothetical protein